MIEAVLPQNLSQNEYKIMVVIYLMFWISFGQGKTNKIWSEPVFMIAGSDICGIEYEIMIVTIL